MAFLSDNVLDNGLNYATTHGSRVDICSAEPANYTEATSTLTLGNKTGHSVGAPQNGDVNGRKVSIAAITDGVVTLTANATHWALSKVTATTELLAANTLQAAQVVNTANNWSMPAVDITIPDPA